MNALRKKFAINLSYAFIAQGISLIMSLLISLFVPKLLNVEAFAYWQLFIFYSSYIPFFHFGLNDGVYLKYGGVSYENMDKSSIKSQMYFGIFYESIISICIIIIASILLYNNDRFFVIIASSIYFLIFSTSNYLGYIFQAANQTKIYSISIMLSRSIFIFVIGVFLIFRVNSYQSFIALYIVAIFISLFYCIFKGKAIFHAKLKSLSKTINESLNSISIGIKLMLSNIASMLIIGVIRLFIDNKWGIIAFGKFSFSLTLTNFILTFINQVSIVLFPALRQVEKNKQQYFYKIAHNMLELFLPIVFIGYIPVKIILNLWLPQYRESIHYLALLLPICVFDGKMQMLYSTYLKVLRKEKILLMINVITVMISTFFAFLGCYVLKNINIILIFTVISIAFRSIISEIYLTKLMKLNITRKIISEIFIPVIFMICNWYMSTMNAFIIMMITYIAYLINNKKDLYFILNKTKNIIKINNR
jgi:O-antigen/teichoic acid export membrane protein